MFAVSHTVKVPLIDEKYDSISKKNNNKYAYNRIAFLLFVRSLIKDYTVP